MPLKKNRKQNQYPLPKLKFKKGDRVSDGVTKGTITATDKENRSFPYTVLWDNGNETNVYHSILQKINE